MIGNTRFTNTTDMSVYTETFYIEDKCLNNTWYSDREELSRQSAMEEFMFLGLRMTDGICEKAFEEAFGETIMDVYGDVLTKHTANGLLGREDGRIFLTEHGLDLANQVMSDFLL